MEDSRIIIAVATSDGETLVNSHFGDAEYFYIYEMSSGECKFVSRLVNTSKRACEETLHIKRSKAREIKNLLNNRNVKIILARKMGTNIQRMKQDFIPVIARFNSIDNALSVLSNQLEQIISNRKNSEKEYFILSKV